MKKILNLVLLVFITIPVLSQPKNWQHLDLGTDSVFGISSNKARNELLRDKKAVQVIVAVIDNGIDTAHEDLAEVLWKNKREANRKINGIDDDHNNYVDDVNGWSFLGSKGKDIHYDNLEITRLVRNMQQRCDTADEYKILKKEFDKKLAAANENLSNIEEFQKIVNGLISALGTNEPTIGPLKGYLPKSKGEAYVIKVFTGQLQQGKTITDFIKEQVTGGITYYKNQIGYHLNLSFNPREGMAEGGVRDVNGPDPDHGTHVAGIIGAIRNNNKGIEGIASVKIMMIRAVPDGDEKDEDIAKAIIYAVANGAKIINMSFGKPYSPGKKLVDDAVHFAMLKDVLLIHAAGNDGKNLDSVAGFPTKTYLSGKEAEAWLEVGASSPTNNELLVAGFSNYGKNTVDVFAPGVNIYSASPGSKYAYHDGTSMAAPVVAGIAALIRGYYPKLTAVQVKEIIMNSVTKAEPLKDKCKTGGVVNAYEALKLAAEYK